MIGAGLIGGSLLRAAEKAGRTVWGSCASAETARQAAADGFDVGTDTDAALARAAAADALVVLAVPLPALPEVLRRVDRVAPTCRLTDAVSVKVATAEAVRRFAPAGPLRGRAPDGRHRGVRLGGRAGRAVHRRGLGGRRRRRAGHRGVGRRGRAGLGLRRPGGARRGRPSTTSPWPRCRTCRTCSPPCWPRLARPGRAGEQDALALSLAASSFADGTRVAGTRPELVLAMCEGNRDALLAAVDDALGRLGAMRGALASTGGLAATVRAGHAGRQQFLAARRPARRAAARVRPLSLAELRTLGRRGHVLLGWS